MKLKLISTLSLLSFIFLHDGSMAQSQKIQISGRGNVSHTFKTTTGIKSTDVEYDGTIVFNDTDTDVESISRGGFLIISQRTFGTRRTVTLEGKSDGTISREFKIGGREYPWEPDGAEWLADVLLDVIRSSGIGAETRVARFYKKGGIDALTDEIDEIESDYVKSIYFIHAVKLDGLKTSDLNSLVKEAAEQIGSDFELARFFIQNSDIFLENESSVSTLLKSTEEISSDFEHARVLTHYISKKNISEEQERIIITSTSGISSDFEQSRVLLSLINKKELSRESLRVLLESVDEISSDFEASKVLQALIKKQEMNNTSIGMIIEASSNISSDFEQARVLKTLTGLDLSEENLTAVAEATQDISSDFEKSGVLVSILDKNKFAETDMAIVIKASEGISSDFEHAKVLGYIIKQGPLDDKNFQAVTRATEEISSTFEKNRVLKALIVENDLNKQKSLWLLGAIDDISSNFEKAGVMIVLGPKLPNDDEVHEAFRKTARTITSDFDYGRVMRSVDF